MSQSLELPTLPAYVPHGSPATARIVIVRSHGSPCGETGAGTRAGVGAGMATGVGWSTTDEGPPPQPEVRNATAATVARRRARTPRIYGALARRVKRWDVMLIRRVLLAGLRRTSVLTGVVESTSAADPADAGCADRSPVVQFGRPRTAQIPPHARDHAMSGTAGPPAEQFILRDIRGGTPLAL